MATRPKYCGLCFSKTLKTECCGAKPKLLKTLIIDHGFSDQQVNRRLKCGWTYKEALTTPLYEHRRTTSRYEGKS